jgi:hypothetical protein
MSEKNNVLNISEKDLKDIVDENTKNQKYYIDFDEKDNIYKDLINNLSCSLLNFNDPRKAEICENMYYVLKSITQKINYGDYRYIKKELLSLFKFDFVVNFSSYKINEKEELRKFLNDVCLDTVKLQQTLEIIMAFNKLIDEKTQEDSEVLGPYFLYRVPFEYLDRTSNFSTTTALLGIKKTARNFYRNTNSKEDIHKIYINKFVDKDTKEKLNKIVTYDEYLCGMYSSTENNFTSWNRITRNLPSLSWTGGKKNRKTRKNNKKSRTERKNNKKLRKNKGPKTK